MRKRQENIWLGEVYENTYQLFLYITMKYLQKREDAEEIVHDVYVKWGENSEKYKGKSLDEKDYLILKLRFFMEHSYKEMAEELNVSVNQVGVWLNRAKNICGGDGK